MRSILDKTQVSEHAFTDALECIIYCVKGIIRIFDLKSIKLKKFFFPISKIYLFIIRILI